MTGSTGSSGSTRHDDAGHSRDASPGRLAHRALAHSLLILALALAACATQTSQAPPAAQRPTLPNFATPAPPIDRSLKPLLGEDPSAPADTPLCGMAARERNAIGADLPRSGSPSPGPCDTYACYDPLTATYIGADGYRHICR